MCASGANERNENGLTGVGAASNWHLRGGKNGDGSKGDPTSYDGFDLVKMGAVKADPTKEEVKTSSAGKKGTGARSKSYKTKTGRGLGDLSKASTSSAVLLGA